jgi:hypothetical protein
MSRNVQVVILCEDRQHEAFARRFLAKANLSARIQRVEVSPRGRGSGEQFVRERFVKELAYYRSRRHRVQQVLIVLIDADGRDIGERIRQFDSVCTEAQCRCRQHDECVGIVIPARNIETWFAYLEGQPVNEHDTYPRLHRERDCQRHVDTLFEMCQKGILEDPAPPSLEAACQEYRLRLPTY